MPSPHDWEKAAKCHIIGANTDLFYPPRDKALYKPIADRAKGICKGKDGLPPCSVKKDCLLQAIRNDEVFGIWGGMSHRERNALVRKAKKTGVTIEALVEALEKTWEN